MKKPTVSIIIPHRDRSENLRHCLRSIHSSAFVCGCLDEFEVLVVDDGWTAHRLSKLPSEWDRVRVIIDAAQPPVELKPREPPPFWKNRLLNTGLRFARGTVFTFLDADAIVGPRFMEAWRELKDRSITRLCYRVRYVDAAQVEEAMDRWHGLEHLFQTYDSHRLATECYGEPELRGTGGEPVFGNSQFSIRREVLDEISFQWDESYVGRTCEDLSGIREIYRRTQPNYKGKLVGDGDHALLHITHSMTPGFAEGDRWSQANSRRYETT